MHPLFQRSPSRDSRLHTQSLWAESYRAVLIDSMDLPCKKTLRSEEGTAQYTLTLRLFQDVLKVDVARIWVA